MPTELDTERKAVDHVTFEMQSIKWHEILYIQVLLLAKWMTLGTLLGIAFVYFMGERPATFHWVMLTFWLTLAFVSSYTFEWRAARKIVNRKHFENGALLYESELESTSEPDTRSDPS